MNITKETIWISNSSNNNIIEKVSNYVNSQNHPISLNEIWQHLWDEDQIKCQKQRLTTILKDSLGWSYRRISSRPNNVDFLKIRACRNLFSVRLGKWLQQTSVIMNVDECSINYKTKSNYSWTPKYEWKDFQNASFCDSISVILWVMSNGDWGCSIIKHTINSEIFSIFLKHLKGWVMRKYPNF